MYGYCTYCTLISVPGIGEPHVPNLEFFGCVLVAYIVNSVKPYICWTYLKLSFFFKACSVSHLLGAPPQVMNSRLDKSYSSTIGFFNRNIIIAGSMNARLIWKYKWEIVSILGQDVSSKLWSGSKYMSSISSPKSTSVFEWQKCEKEIIIGSNKSFQTSRLHGGRW